MVLFIVKDSIPLKAFVFKMRRYHLPITYKKALAWVETGQLPIWPRAPKERISVRISKLDKLFKFLDFDKSTIEAILQDLNS